MYVRVVADSRALACGLMTREHNLFKVARSLDFFFTCSETAPTHIFFSAFQTGIQKLISPSTEEKL